MMLPQGYKQMMQRCALLLLAGTVLHLLFGKINPSFLSYPWGLVLALNYIYLLIILRINAQKWKWVQSWYSQPAYITSLASMLVLTILFGLIRQDGSTEGWIGSIGFTAMSSSWIFNLFLLQFTSTIGLKAIDDVWHWKGRKLGSVLSHVSFFILLVAAIFGSGDKLRLKAVLPVGMPIHRGVTPGREPVELPFTLTLKEFVCDDHPPRYLSTVEITEPDGKTRTCDISVNHPANVGVWKIYQTGFNHTDSRQPTVSILECVRDGWYTVIHICMWMMLIAGVFLMAGGWRNPKKKENKS